MENNNISTQQSSFDIPVFGAPPGALDVPQTSPAVQPSEPQEVRAKRGRPKLKQTVLESIVVAPETAQRANALAAHLDKVWIWHEDFKRVMGVAHALIQRAGTTPEPGGMRVIAPSRCGKTRIYKRLAIEFPTQLEGRPTMPILYIKLKSSVSGPGMLRAMLTALKAPYSRRDTEETLMDLLLPALVSRGVKLIVIDEAQHIVRGGKGKSAMAVSDTLKGLYDDSALPMVLLGVEDLARLFEMDPQLGLRVTMETKMDRFEYGDNFLDALKTLQDNLPLKTKLELNDPKVGLVFHDGTQGRLGTMVLLLKEAIRQAVYSESEELGWQHLELAYPLVVGTLRENLFAMSAEAYVENRNKKAN